MNCHGGRNNGNRQRNISKTAVLSVNSGKTPGIPGEGNPPVWNAGQSLFQKRVSNGEKVGSTRGVVLVI